MDPGSSEFFEDGRYKLRTEKRMCSLEEMVDYYENLVNAYPICSLEDGLAEDDWEGWQVMNGRLGDLIELIGDDLFVTNVAYIERGIREDSANAALIKLNHLDRNHRSGKDVSASGLGSVRVASQRRDRGQFYCRYDRGPEYRAPKDRRTRTR